MSQEAPTKNPTHQAIVQSLLARHGRTFAEQIGLRLEKETPAVLFQWLCASILFSARISGEIAVSAAKALIKDGLTTPVKMADATWERRTKLLNQSGYARYDERTSTMLGDTAKLLLEHYKGDLRRLREKASRDPEEERKLLKQFKGLGDTGVDIFFREIQEFWEEIAPFADKKALSSARKLGLPEEAEALRDLVSGKDFPRLLTGLVRCELKKDQDAVLERAVEHPENPR